MIYGTLGTKRKLKPSRIVENKNYRPYGVDFGRMHLALFQHLKPSISNPRTWQAVFQFFLKKRQIKSKK
jgi:hypothetical protein